MKKFLILILIIGALGTLHYFYRKVVESQGVVPETVTDTTFNPDPSSATFRFDDEMVTLSQGKSLEEDGAGIPEETILLEENAYGDLNSDGKKDSVVLLARSGGGSGTFIYAAAFVSGPVSYKGTNAVFLGDRIAPESITISNGVATVKYLDRNPDEALAAEPTVPVAKQFIYKNGEFVEK